jgi:hypothetical protein
VFQYRFIALGGQIFFTSPAGMVRVAMGYDRFFYRIPGIDKKIAGRTKKAGLCHFKQFRGNHDKVISGGWINSQLRASHPINGKINNPFQECNGVFRAFGQCAAWNDYLSVTPAKGADPDFKLAKWVKII